jgi:hypothetical protein
MFYRSVIVSKEPQLPHLIKISEVLARMDSRDGVQANGERNEAAIKKVCRPAVSVCQAADA